MAAKESSEPPRSPQQLSTSTGPGTADPNPSPTALPALARFEFETGRGNEGTKILMVEWDPSPASGSDPSGGDWEVSWEGKKTFLPTSDQAGSQKRVYFLLPPGAPIPPLVTISRPKGPKLVTKPLPAIFPPGLGVSQRDTGKRGVLHTIWAKKRLSELQEEITSEMKTNVEGVGLEMALQEKKWIHEEFGIGSELTASALEPLMSPMSPKSPIGGRLGEKLKGLKLATSPSDLAAPNSRNTPNAQVHSLSPVAGDIAVSSFSSFQGKGLSSESFENGARSLDAALKAANANGDTAENEDLFALPMSPRSPEMKKSPFSLL